MSKEEFELLASVMGVSKDYIEEIYNNEKYSTDKKLMDCKFYLQLCLIASSMKDEETSNKYCNEFEKIYITLNLEQKEYINNYLKQVFEAQDQLEDSEEDIKKGKEKEKKL